MSPSGNSLVADIDNFKARLGLGKHVHTTRSGDKLIMANGMINKFPSFRLRVRKCRAFHAICEVSRDQTFFFAMLGAKRHLIQNADYRGSIKADA